MASGVAVAPADRPYADLHARRYRRPADEHVDRCASTQSAPKVGGQELDRSLVRAIARSGQESLPADSRSRRVVTSWTSGAPGRDHSRGLGPRGAEFGAARAIPRGGSDGTRTRDLRRDRAGVAARTACKSQASGGRRSRFASPFYASAAGRSRRQGSHGVECARRGGGGSRSTRGKCGGWAQTDSSAIAVDAGPMTMSSASSASAARGARRSRARRRAWWCWRSRARRRGSCAPSKPRPRPPGSRPPAAATRTCDAGRRA